MRRLCREDQITDNQEGKVDDRYMQEVERMTSRREALHARRERAVALLVEAESKVAEAKKTRSRTEIKAAWALVEARRQELRKIEMMMTSNPGASSSHRGTKSIWPAHVPGQVHRGDPDPGPRTRDGKRHPVLTSRLGREQDQ